VNNEISADEVATDMCKLCSILDEEGASEIAEDYVI
jgi:hypothetical protein